MLYTLRQGQSEQLILRQSLKDGLPLPDAIKNAPELFLGLELFYNSFWDLSSCRNSAFGTGEISWSDIEYYCNVGILDDELKNDMHYFIKQMDFAYIKYIDAKSKAKKVK